MRQLTYFLERKVYEEKKNLFDYLCKPFRPYFVKKYLGNPWFGLTEN